MKNIQARQATEDIRALIATGDQLQIISGEGEYGTCEPYEGKQTVHAIKCRLTKECCNGDRWARIDTLDGAARANAL